jgi:hypothetical protein
MRNDRLAEGLLSLVAPADRAASAVGDLMEDRRHAQGGFWFWRSVARIGLAMLGRDLIRSPLTAVAAAALAWFLYMGLSALFALAGYVAVTLAWGLVYFFSHHTGGELLVNALLIRIDFPPIPATATYAIQVAAFFVVSPYQLGRGSARHWRGRELTLAIITLPVWLSMSVLVPFVGIGVRATPPMMPLAVAFVLLGLLDARFRPARASA